MKRCLIFILALGFCMSGCREEATQADPIEEKEARDEDLIGLTLSEAEKRATKRGLLYRVTMLDGTPQPATRDFLQNRVNFAVEQGKVVGVSRG